MGYFCWSLLDSKLLLLPHWGVHVRLILKRAACLQTLNGVTVIMSDLDW